MEFCGFLVVEVVRLVLLGDLPVSRVYRDSCVCLFETCEQRVLSCIVFRVSYVVLFASHYW